MDISNADLERELLKGLIALSILLALVAFAITGIAHHRKEQAALMCARASIGTDQAIYDCFTAQGIEPEDL